MSAFENPPWLSELLYPFQKFEEIEPEVFAAINKNLDAVQSETPDVSIVIIAWNEETNVLRCVASLAKTISKVPFEIIVVNNNSTDKTQDTLNQLHVQSVIETKQGAGPARQRGQEVAKGKYILTADADCFYPPQWLDEMVKVLRQPNVVCVYGRYSFISEPDFPRWKLYMLEKMKDLMAEIRHVKQPYFNTFGISMGYVAELGRKIGFIEVNRRGEDGQLCMDLMQYGKIKQVKASKARVWTGARTLHQSGNFRNIVFSRIKEDLNRFKYNFISRKQS